MDDVEREGEARAQSSQVGAAAAPVRGWRMTAGREGEAVLRVLRGEPLELMAREFAVTAADLSAWRDAFVEAGETSLKTRGRSCPAGWCGRLMALPWGGHRRSLAWVRVAGPGA